MNLHLRRYSSCSRNGLLHSHHSHPIESGRKSIAPSLSVSVSPWRQRDRSQWNCAPKPGEASLKVATAATVSPGAGDYRRRSLETLQGCAKMWVKSERLCNWSQSILTGSGTTSYVCLSQSISEVASNLKATAFSAQWTRSRRQGENLHLSSACTRDGRVLRGAETERPVNHRKRERLSLHLLLLFWASWHSEGSVR